MALSDIIGSVGGRAFISASLPTAATRLAYEALPWTEIGLISDLGSLGKTFNETTFTPAKEAKVVPKLTSSDNGEVQIVYAYTASADAGHAILAARLGKRVSLCFALPNGKCKYFQVLVKSEVVNVGTVDNIVTETCALRITEDDIVRADTPWWFAVDSPYWWFAGQAGFFTDLNPVHGKVFTTSVGSEFALNPGDPIGRIESIAGGMALRQPSSPLRPTLARAPRVGITNLIGNSILESIATGTLPVTDGSEFFDGTRMRRYPASTVAELHSVTRGMGASMNAPDATKIRLYGVWVRLPASSDVSRIWFRGRAGGNGAGMRFAKSGASWIAEAIVNPFGEAPPAMIALSDAVMVQHPQVGDIWFLGFKGALSSDSSLTATSLDIRFSNGPTENLAGTANTVVEASGWTISNNLLSPLPYQRVVSPNDIRQQDVADEWYISSNGTQWMTFESPNFGAAKLFAEAGEQWTSLVKFLTFTQAHGALLAATNSGTNTTTKFLQSIGGATAGIPYSVLRNGTSSAAWGAPVSPNQANTGSPNSLALRWNGSEIAGWRNGIRLAASQPVVGTAANEVANITVFCRNQMSPIQLLAGYMQPPLIIDSALNSADIQRIAA